MKRNRIVSGYVFNLIALSFSIFLTGCYLNSSIIKSSLDQSTSDAPSFKVETYKVNSAQNSDNNLEIFYNSDVSSLSLLGEFKNIKDIALWTDSSCSNKIHNFSSEFNETEIKLTSISPPFVNNTQELYLGYKDSLSKEPRCYEKPIKINLKRSLGEFNLSLEAPFSAIDSNANPRIVSGKPETQESVRIFLSADCSGSPAHQISWQDFGSTSVLIQNPITFPVGQSFVSVLQFDAYGNSSCRRINDYSYRPFSAVTKVAATDSAFAALRSDGSVIAWGEPATGGDIGSIASELNGTIPVTDIVGGQFAFAALRADGKVITWGYSFYTAYTQALKDALNGSIPVTQIFASKNNFAALRSDGSVVSWATTPAGVWSSLDGTIDAVQIKRGTYLGVIRNDGSLVSLGIDATSIASQINGTIPVVDYVDNWYAGAVIRTNGSVVTWGSASYGGDSSTVASQMNGSVAVTKIVPTTYAMAALRSDGTVVTWGSSF